MRSQKGHDPLPNPIFQGFGHFHTFCTSCWQCSQVPLPLFGKGKNASNLMSFRSGSVHSTLGKIDQEASTPWSLRRDSQATCTLALGAEWMGQMISFKGKKKTTFLGTNISHQKSLLKMMFLFPRWDMLVLWRVKIVNSALKGMEWHMEWWNDGRFWEAAALGKTCNIVMKHVEKNNCKYQKKQNVHKWHDWISAALAKGIYQWFVFCAEWVGSL